MAQSVDNDSASVRVRHVCCCKKRIWKRRHLAAITVALALHYAPLRRMCNNWRGIRDEEIFPSKNIRGRFLADSSYVCQGEQKSPISPAQFGVDNFHRIRIPIQGELSCHQGYFLAQPNSQDVATLVYFQNTNENLGMLTETLCNVYNNLKVNVVCADMRGLGTCSGVPNSESMAEDARRITKYVATGLNSSSKEIPQINTEKIFVFGHNLACHAALGVASHPEVRDHIKGAIVSNPLPSILDSLPAKEKLAPKYWVRGYYPDRFDNVPLIQNCNQKLLTIGSPHGLEPSISSLNSLIKEAKYSPTRVVLVGGIGSENSLAKLKDLPATFTDAIASFFDDESKHSRDASYFESQNFDSSEVGVIVDPTQTKHADACRKIYNDIDNKVRGWMSYLHGKITDETAGPSDIVKTDVAVVEVAGNNGELIKTVEEPDTSSTVTSDHSELNVPTLNVVCNEHASKKPESLPAATPEKTAPVEISTISASSSSSMKKDGATEFISEIKGEFDHHMNN